MIGDEIGRDGDGEVHALAYDAPYDAANMGTPAALGLRD